MKIVQNILKPQNLFIIICLFWGLLIAIVTPPFQAPDEPEHLFKMWGYTEGTLRYKLQDNWVGDYLPVSFVSIYKNFNVYRFNNSKVPLKLTFYASKISLDKKNQVFFRYNSPVYTPISYFPAFIVLWVLKLLNVSPLLMTYLLRVCFLLTYITLGYIALRIIPCKKWMMFLIQTLPVVLGQSAAINTDSIFLGVFFLLFAYTIKLRCDSNIQQISKKHILIWGLLDILVVILKYAYLPVLFLFLLIPSAKFKSNKTFYEYFFLFILLNFLVLLFIMLGNLNNTGLREIFYGINASASAIIKDILHNPIEYLKSVIYSTGIYFKTKFYYTNVISSIGTTMAVIPLFATNIYWFLLLVSSIYETRDESILKFNIKENIILIISVLLIYLMVITSVYIVWQHYPFIRGVQGRYLTPLLPIILIMFASLNFKLNNKSLPVIIVLISQILLLVNFFCYLVRFY